MKKIKKFIIPALVIAAAAGFFLWKNAHKQTEETPTGEITRVQRGRVASTVSATGVLTPITTINLSSNVGGEIVEMTVDEGDMVKAGQVIARIDPSDLKADLEQAEADNRSSQANLDSAKQNRDMQVIKTQSNIENAKQALAAAEKRLNQAQYEYNVQPTITAENINQAKTNLADAQAALEQTKKATVPQRLASAKASYNEAQAAFEKAENDYARKKELQAKGYISKSDFDAASESYQSAKARLDSAKKTYDTVNDECNQTVKAAEARVTNAQSALKVANANKVQIEIKRQELASAKASVAQAKAALISAKSGVYEDQMREDSIRQAEAQTVKSRAALDKAKTQLGYTDIKAPRDGVVIAKYAEVGSVVTAGKASMGGSGKGITIVDIADITRMQVEVNVDETDIAKVKMGQDVEVTVDAYEDEQFKGKVVKIAPMATSEQNVTSIPVTVEIAQTDNRLKPDMNATCDFIVEKVEDALYLPSEAVTMTDEGAQVQVLKGMKSPEEMMKSGKGPKGMPKGMKPGQMPSGGGRPSGMGRPSGAPSGMGRSGKGAPGGLPKGVTVEKKIIETGVVGDDNTEIKSGLNEGDFILVPDATLDMFGSGNNNRRRGGPRMF
ncbi:MAG: HlyD family secretion protein [Abditibacteriota bacterium]|nr:HlyD family secretion protein [Abditibacteriota bacterium]